MENTDLFREKTYNGNLNIEQQKVSLETDKPFKKIEIQYYGKMNIQSLLPNNYSLKNNILEKKIIIKSGGSEKLNPDLFKYRGKAVIKKCILYLESGKKYNLYVNKSNLELWNTLEKTEKVGTTDGTAQDWAYLTKNWEDISFDGNNAKKPYIHRKTAYDKETRTFTTIKEIRKK